jgi:hypothetical protein
MKDLAIEVATILLTASLSEKEIISTIEEAKDMAIRAERGWWETAGSPAFNKRMKLLAARIEVQK